MENETQRFGGVCMIKCYYCESPILAKGGGYYECNYGCSNYEVGENKEILYLFIYMDENCNIFNFNEELIYVMGFINLGELIKIEKKEIRENELEAEISKTRELLLFI
jgi:hypothetical protein